MESNRNIFKFQGNNMIVHAKGPNMVKNISINSGFRSNLMSSTMNMPRNFEEFGYAEPTRSLYYGRDTSPTGSVRSDFQPRNFHQPFCQGRSSRSTCTGRGGSPVSMRSIDSSSSIHIIRAIKNGNFSEQEWRKMHLAFKRQHNSRMLDRKRKMKQKFKNRRKRSSYDSGEQGSNSSISSDDSTRTGYSRSNRNYKENVPRSLSDFRSTERDFRNNNREMYREYADSNTQNPYRTDTDTFYDKNMASLQTNTQIKSNNMLFRQTGNENRYSSQKTTLTAPKNAFTSHSVINGYGNKSSIQRTNLNSSISTKSLQNQSAISQRDRFENGFQFPSQRFNNSIMPLEHEKNRSIQNLSRRCGNYNQSKQMACVDEGSDDNDDIFPDKTLRPHHMPKNNKLSGQKRNIDSLDNIPITASKKHKALSNNDEPMQKTQAKSSNKNNDFVFAKPAFPVRKSAPAKSRENIIFKSGEPFAGIVFNEQEKSNQPKAVVEPLSQEKEAELELSDTQLTTSDMSMRPSFMKRKLFTQTLDVTERKNNSSENFATDSPQSNIYSELSTEKHKTRKLASSQSLLSRDVNQDDNNLLDLIHKIVPPSQVNTTKRPKVSVDKTAADDKWDVTSIISTCNNDSASDTYTDDEIFNGANDVKKNKSREQPIKVRQSKTINDKKKTIKPETKKVQNVGPKCTVIVERIQILPKNAEVADETCPAKKPVTSNSRIDAFWNTDVESDFEYGTPAKHNDKVGQGTQRHISTPKQSHITSYIDVKSTPATQQTKNTITGNSKPIVVRKNDPTLVKTLKKQTNNQLLTKPNTKIVKNAKDKNSQPGKSEKAKKASPAKKINTRSQFNLSLLDSVEKSNSAKKGTSVSKKLCEKSIKKGNNNKTTEKKVKKTQPSSDSPKTRPKEIQNTNLTDKTRKMEEKNKYRRQPKSSNDQEDTNNMFCKVLRSRLVDLSSSFNSDQFELTGISRVRKSRTPIKVTSLKRIKKS